MFLILRSVQWKKWQISEMGNPGRIGIIWKMEKYWKISSCRCPCGKICGISHALIVHKLIEISPIWLKVMFVVHNRTHSTVYLEAKIAQMEARKTYWKAIFQLVDPMISSTQLNKRMVINQFHLFFSIN